MLLSGPKAMSKLSRIIQWEFKAFLEFFTFRRQAVRTLSSGLFMDDFELVPENGAFRHKLKPGLFCGECVAAHRVYARMNKGQDGWTCFTCGKLYADVAALPEPIAPAP